LSNWTELDIWHMSWPRTFDRAALLSPEAACVERDGTLIMGPMTTGMKLKSGEEIENRLVRFRTLGCYPLTGASIPTRTRWRASSPRCSRRAPPLERQGRLIDSDEKSSMEKKKKEG